MDSHACAAVVLLVLALCASAAAEKLAYYRKGSMGAHEPVCGRPVACRNMGQDLITAIHDLSLPMLPHIPAAWLAKHQFRLFVQLMSGAGMLLGV